MRETIDVFDFELTADEMTRIATLDTGATLFFDHHDPAMVQTTNAGRELVRVQNVLYRWNGSAWS